MVGKSIESGRGVVRERDVGPEGGRKNSVFDGQIESRYLHREKGQEDDDVYDPSHIFYHELNHFMTCPPINSRHQFNLFFVICILSLLPHEIAASKPEELTLIGNRTVTTTTYKQDTVASPAMKRKKKKTFKKSGSRTSSPKVSRTTCCLMALTRIS